MFSLIVLIFTTLFIAINSQDLIETCPSSSTLNCDDYSVVYANYGIGEEQCCRTTDAATSLQTIVRFPNRCFAECNSVSSLLYCGSCCGDIDISGVAVAMECDTTTETCDQVTGETSGFCKPINTDLCIRSTQCDSTVSDPDACAYRGDNLECTANGWNGCEICNTIVTTSDPITTITCADNGCNSKAEYDQCPLRDSTGAFTGNKGECIGDGDECLVCTETTVATTSDTVVDTTTGCTNGAGCLNKYKGAQCPLSDGNGGWSNDKGECTQNTDDECLSCTETAIATTSGVDTTEAAIAITSGVDPTDSVTSTDVVTTGCQSDNGCVNANDDTRCPLGASGGVWGEYGVCEKNEDGCWSCVEITTATPDDVITTKDNGGIADTTSVSEATEDNGGRTTDESRAPTDDNGTQGTTSAEAETTNGEEEKTTDDGTEPNTTEECESSWGHNTPWRPDPGFGNGECALKVQLRLNACFIYLVNACDLENSLWWGLKHVIYGSEVVDDWCDPDRIFIESIDVWSDDSSLSSSLTGAAPSNAGQCPTVEDICGDEDDDNSQFIVDVTLTVRCTDCDRLMESAQGLDTAAESGSLGPDFSGRCLSNSQGYDGVCSIGFGRIYVDGTITVSLWDEQGGETLIWEININGNDAVRKGSHIGIVVVLIVLSLFV